MPNLKRFCADVTPVDKVDFYQLKNMIYCYIVNLKQFDLKRLTVLKRLCFLKVRFGITELEKIKKYKEEVIRNLPNLTEKKKECLDNGLFKICWKKK
jgi:hypothetical protein